MAIAYERLLSITTFVRRCIELISMQILRIREGIEEESSSKNLTEKYQNDLRPMTSSSAQLPDLAGKADIKAKESLVPIRQSQIVTSDDLQTFIHHNIYNHQPSQLTSKWVPQHPKPDEQSPVQQQGNILRGSRHQRIRLQLNYRQRRLHLKQTTHQK